MYPAISQRNDDIHDRKRSHSPYRDPGHDRAKRHRSRSPQRKHRHHHHHRHSSHTQKSPQQITIPFRRHALQKGDYESYTPLFAYYLDVQKQLNFLTLSNDEAKGRWKSFMAKWNRGELAEGWYDPAIQVTAQERYSEASQAVVAEKAPKYERRINIAMEEEEEDEDDDGDFGPALPSKATSKAGPSIPTQSDIQYRKELAQEADSANRADLLYSRRQDRKLQKERLEEFAPRGDPGSKERQMEKKRDAAAVKGEFRDAKESGDVEVGENELMGDDGIAGYKAQLKANQKVKNEREIRKEEVLRARAAEREEKVREVRAKEDKTMEMLKGIARQRFG